MPYEGVAKAAPDGFSTVNGRCEDQDCGSASRRGGYRSQPPSLSMRRPTGMPRRGSQCAASKAGGASAERRRMEYAWRNSWQTLPR